MRACLPSSTVHRTSRGKQCGVFDKARRDLTSERAGAVSAKIPAFDSGRRAERLWLGYRRDC